MGMRQTYCFTQESQDTGVNHRGMETAKEWPTMTAPTKLPADSNIAVSASSGVGGAGWAASLP